MPNTSETLLVVRIINKPAMAVTVALLAGLLGARGSAEAATPANDAERTTTVEGGLDKSAVRAVVSAQIDDVRDCYTTELGDDETAAGRIVVSFVIQPDGSPVDVGVAESTMSARFDGCMTTTIERWSFPTSATDTRVTYPFVLSLG